MNKFFLLGMGALGVAGLTSVIVGRWKENGWAKSEPELEPEVDVNMDEPDDYPGEPQSSEKALRPDIPMVMDAPEGYSKENMDRLLEKLSDLEHDQWLHWTKYMLKSITEENIKRWERQIKTPYKDLSEKEKESDRVWARKVIKLFRDEGLL